jgi:bacterial leucyl aminopeptidase
MRLQSFLAILAAALPLAVKCAPISHEEIEANVAQNLRLLSLEEGVEPVWKTEEEKLDLMRQGVQFVGLSFARCKAVSERFTV